MKLLIVISTFCLFGLSVTEDILEKLQVVFRHGSLNPGVMKINNDSCHFSSDPGQLTEIGKHQSQLLGYSLRLRYDAFLGNNINVTVLSCGTSFCEESARLTIGATFLLYTQAPIAINMSSDMVGNMSCLNYLNTTWNSSFPKAMDYNSLIRETNASCSNVNTINTLFHLEDYLQYVMAENCKLPDPQICQQDKLAKLYKKFLSSFLLCDSSEVITSNTDNLQKYFIAQFNDTSPKANKTILYALQQEEMAALLTRMSVYNGQPIPLAAAVYFELRRNGGNHYVRVFYDNTTDHLNVTQLKLSQCDWNCPLDKFISLTQKIQKCSKNCCNSFQAVVMFSLLSVLCSLFKGNWNIL